MIASGTDCIRTVSSEHGAPAFPFPVSGLALVPVMFVGISSLASASLALSTYLTVTYKPPRPAAGVLPVLDLCRLH